MTHLSDGHNSMYTHSNIITFIDFSYMWHDRPTFYSFVTTPDVGQVV